MSEQRPKLGERERPGFVEEWSTKFTGSPSHLTPVDYLDSDEGYRATACATWLFCPETVEYRGGVFLAERFTAGNADDWIDHFDGSVDQAEDVVNETRLFDLFGYANIDAYGIGLAHQVAVAIGECWQGVLERRFPDRDVIVEVRDEDDDAYGPSVTFWTVHQV